MKTPGNWTVDKLFKNRPVSQKLFELIERYIKSLGQVKVSASKTQVSFGTKKKFAWVWLPQMWIKKQPNESVVLTFSLTYRIEDPKIKQSIEASKDYWTHHVVIDKEDNFDNKVKNWIKLAYEMGMAEKKRQQKL